MTPTVSLPQYEGPIDMLLDLVREKQLDILNLPLAEVTRQYLAYLAAAEKLDLNLDSEWFYIAALLIHMKSRSLLPQTPDHEGGDSQGELVGRLLDREQLEGAARYLEAQWSAHGGWPPPPATHMPLSPALEEPPAARGSLSLLEVLELAQKALASVSAAEELEMAPPSVPMEEMLAWLEDRLAQAPPGKPLDFADLWKAVPSDQHRSALFLAVLEAARSRRLDLEQQECFAPLWLHPAG